MLINFKNVQNQELLHGYDWPKGNMRSPKGTTSAHQIQQISLASHCFALVFKAEWKQ